jgi:menaquinone-dependent protoporphyrinogen oxidase
VKRKVLVAYATRAGSTGEVAQAIGERLRAAGMQADVRPVERGLPLEGYDAVVLGSPIRYSAWLPEMTEFIAGHRDALARVPLAIFTLHMQALGNDAASRKIRVRYAQPVRSLVNPRDEAYFAGNVDPATLSFFERLAVKMVKSPVGDKRDWAAVRAWADGLGALLQ